MLFDLQINFSWPKENFVGLRAEFTDEVEARKTLEAILQNLYPDNWKQINGSQYASLDISRDWGRLSMACIYPVPSRQEIIKSMIKSLQAELAALVATEDSQ